MSRTSTTIEIRRSSPPLGAIPIHGPLTLLPSSADAVPLPPTFVHLTVLLAPLSPDASISGYTPEQARSMLLGVVRSLPAHRELLVEERI